MVRGRKPTHPALKVLRGNPGKRRVKTDKAPAASAVPACPKYLDAAAADAWREIGGQLVALGVLAETDTIALAALCECWARYREAMDATAAMGSVLIARDSKRKPRLDKNGLPILKRSAHSIAAQKWLAWVHKWCGEFGLTPTARARLRPGQADDRGDAVLKILDAS